jgi:site-specific DNA recombinase
MKAILIARVSTDDQADALGGQIYKLEDYAHKHELDFKLIQIKESAYKGDRVEFNKVISRVQDMTEKVALVFDKVDRYSRDVSSPEVRILNSLCRQGKIELHFVSDYLVLTENSSANQWFMLSLNTSTSQLYSNQISDNVKRRQDQMLRDGIWTGKAPRGYRNTLKDNKKWIEVDPLEALAVKDAYESYSSGMLTLKGIKDLWAEKYNITTSVSHIDRVLKNPFYYGFMQVKGQLYNHNYEHLVSKEVFDRCEDIRTGFKSKPNSVGGLPFVYKGLIKCAYCGCMITFETKKQHYTYGHCSQYKGKHGAKYLSEQTFTDQYEGLLKSIMVPDVIMEKILTLINEDRIKQNAESANKRSLLNSEIAKYEKRIDRLYEDSIDGKIDEDFYIRKSKDYKDSIDKLKTELSTFELSDNNRLETVSHLLEVAKNAHKIFVESDYLGKRKILKKVLSNSLLDGDRLLLELKKPYDTMAFSNNNSTWQGYVESNHGFRFWRPTH